MKIGLLSALALCLLSSALGAAPSASDYPEQEVWFGVGGAGSFEKNIFNVPNAIASTPDVVSSLGYIVNLDARRAVGFQLGVSGETVPSFVSPGPGGSPLGPFDLSLGNLGMRYRHTFSRATLSPYLFVGAGWAVGSLESSATGSLDYSGISVCAGPGASVRLGRHFMISAEGIGSFGWAKWNTQPLPTSSGRQFNPSLVGGTVNLSFVWGDKPASAPASDTLAIRDSSLALATPGVGYTNRPSPLSRALSFVILEGCIVFLSAPATADDQGRLLAGITAASALLGGAAGGAGSPESFRIMFFGLLTLAAAELAIGRAGATPEALFWTSVFSWNALGYASSRADRKAKARP